MLRLMSARFHFRQHLDATPLGLKGAVFLLSFYFVRRIDLDDSPPDGWVPYPLRRWQRVGHSSPDCRLDLCVLRALGHSPGALCALRVSFSLGLHCQLRTVGRLIPSSSLRTQRSQRSLR